MWVTRRASPMTLVPWGIIRCSRLWLQRSVVTMHSTGPVKELLRRLSKTVSMMVPSKRRYIGPVALLRAFWSARGVWACRPGRSSEGAGGVALGARVGRAGCTVEEARFGRAVGTAVLVAGGGGAA